MEPGMYLTLGKYDTWVPLPDEVESILSQLQRVTQKNHLTEENTKPLVTLKYQDSAMTDEFQA